MSGFNFINDLAWPAYIRVHTMGGRLLWEHAIPSRQSAQTSQPANTYNVQYWLYRDGVWINQIHTEALRPGVMRIILMSDIFGPTFRSMLGYDQNATAESALDAESLKQYVSTGGQAGDSIVALYARLGQCAKAAGGEPPAPT